MALIKKDSEVPSYALIFEAELILNLTLQMHAKKVFYIMAPTFAINSTIFIWHETYFENKYNYGFLWSFINSFTLNNVLRIPNLALHKYQILIPKIKYKTEQFVSSLALRYIMVSS